MWVLGNIQRIIRQPHCANLTHSDLDQMAIRYEQLGEFWTVIKQAGGVIETNHVCFAERFQSSDEKKKLFTPVGSFLTVLLEKLAWRDPGLRPLAEYFVLAEMLGSGQGTGRMWPLTVLSDEIST